MPESSAAQPAAPSATVSVDRLRAIRRSVSTIALEILVGFVGVYAAFALAAEHDRRDLEQRRHQVRLALIEEIKEMKRGSGQMSKGVGAWIAKFDSATAADGRPPLQPLLTNQRVDTYIWSATQQTGGLLLLDVPTYMRLASYYHDVGRVSDELDHLRARSELVLLPNVDRGLDEFYSAPGKIRIKYAWYPLGMRQLQQSARSVNLQSDSLIVLLQRADAK